MIGRMMPSDDQWERIAPLIIGRLADQKGSTDGDGRMFVEGVPWIVSEASPWSAPPGAADLTWA